MAFAANLDKYSELAACKVVPAAGINVIGTVQVADDFSINVRYFGPGRLILQRGAGYVKASRGTPSAAGLTVVRLGKKVHKLKVIQGACDVSLSFKFIHIIGGCYRRMYNTIGL